MCKYFSGRRPESTAMWLRRAWPISSSERDFNVREEKNPNAVQTLFVHWILFPNLPLTPETVHTNINTNGRHKRNFLNQCTDFKTCETTIIGKICLHEAKMHPKGFRLHGEIVLPMAMQNLFTEAPPSCHTRNCSHQLKRQHCKSPQWNSSLADFYQFMECI